MLVPALVLVAVALVLAVVGVLARLHRLPRNRVVGVRTPWTMSRTDTFRRANRAAAPAFLAAGGVGIVAGTTSALAPSTVTAATLLAVGIVGTVVLVGVAGVVGTRFAAADEAEEVRAAPAAGPCCSAAPESVPADPDLPGPAQPAESDGTACAPAGCAGACELCPQPRRATAAPGA